MLLQSPRPSQEFSKALCFPSQKRSVRAHLHECLQQALALFRTQRILKIYIELDSRENKMVAAVSGENGEASMQSYLMPNCTFLLLHAVAALMVD